ncbi:MAG: hypothetical protein JO099_19490 [Acidobacteriia bacterium]|nr:hypothetical protein [Terriglobia bacterium]
MLVIFHVEMDLGFALDAQETVFQIDIRKFQDALFAGAQPSMAGEHNPLAAVVEQRGAHPFTFLA